MGWGAAAALMGQARGGEGEPVGPSGQEAERRGLSLLFSFSFFYSKFIFKSIFKKITLNFEL